MRETLYKRFWSKVKIKTPDSCWLWTTTLLKDGYGQFWLDGKFVKPHRMVLFLVRGIALDSYGQLTVDHLCRVRHCVNPDHLDIVSLRENLLRGETLTARNTRKTHCPLGHKYNGFNLYHRPGLKGHRGCRQCRTLARRKCASKRKTKHFG